MDLNEPNKVRVECRDGAGFQADHVICTMPLGYLKANHKYEDPSHSLPILYQFSESECYTERLFHSVARFGR